MYAKMSKKGQITIPKAIRHRLNIEKEGAVLSVVEEGDVKLRGISATQAQALSGSLHGYAKR